MRRQRDLLIARWAEMRTSELETVAHDHWQAAAIPVALISPRLFYKILYLIRASTLSFFSMRRDDWILKSHCAAGIAAACTFDIILRRWSRHQGFKPVPKASKGAFLSGHERKLKSGSFQHHLAGPSHHLHIFIQKMSKDAYNSTQPSHRRHPTKLVPMDKYASPSWKLLSLFSFRNSGRRMRDTTSLMSSSLVQAI